MLTTKSDFTPSSCHPKRREYRKRDGKCAQCVQAEYQMKSAIALQERAKEKAKDGFNSSLKSSTPLKRSPLKPKRPRNTGEAEVFKQIAQERPHVCFVTGQPIRQLTVSCFAHVLSKAQNKYPRFKLYKKNIRLVLPEVHHLIDHGSSDQRQRYKEKMATKGVTVDWDGYFALYEELLNEYKSKHGAF